MDLCFYFFKLKMNNMLSHSISFSLSVSISVEMSALAPLLQDILDSILVMGHLGLDNAFERFWESHIFHVIILWPNFVHQFDPSWQFLLYNNLPDKFHLFVNFTETFKECCSCSRVTCAFVDL